MTPDSINFIRRCLPDEVSFPYYKDRESAWLAANLMGGDCTVATFKQSEWAKLLSRPILRTLVAGCGGILAQRDVLALAHADRATAWSGLSTAAEKSLDDIYASSWMEFRLSFAAWGTGNYSECEQLSRKGGNLVLQLGFPSDHAEPMGRYLSKDCRKSFEFRWHPIRLDGCPTLAWARLDIDLATGTALIEEIQSDWLRFVRESIEDLQESAPRSRELRQHLAYERDLKRRYEKLWPRAMLLATLVLLRDELGCRTVFLHQPEVGAALKSITGEQPPRSLYTSLPRSFCFRPTRDVPSFLARSRTLRRFKHRGEPLFWQLSL